MAASAAVLWRSGPSLFNQWTYSYKDVATKVCWSVTPSNSAVKLTRLYYLERVQRLQRSPGLQFLQLWDLQRAPPGRSGSNSIQLTAPPRRPGKMSARTSWGFFAQDDFKVLPNLTINLGATLLLLWSFVVSMAT